MNWMKDLRTELISLIYETADLSQEPLARTEADAPC